MVEDVLPEVYFSQTGLRQQLLQASKDNRIVDMQKFFLDLTTTVVGYMAYDVSEHPIIRILGTLNDISTALKTDGDLQHAPIQQSIRPRLEPHRATVPESTLQAHRTIHRFHIPLFPCRGETLRAGHCAKR